MIILTFLPMMYASRFTASEWIEIYSVMNDLIGQIFQFIKSWLYNMALWFVHDFNTNYVFIVALLIVFCIPIFFFRWKN